MMIDFEIVAVSSAIRSVIAVIERVALTDANLLIYGESGTGKDLLAHLLHYKSQRHNSQLVKVDCSTLPQELVESELFGYERGAFTGAVNSKPGRLEAANGGTLVFDEIIHLGLQAQAKLLRVLQEHSFMRLGGISPIKIDVRFVALTNTDLEFAVSKGLLRADLFHRLNVVSVELPPLRERIKDIPFLIEHFIKRSAIHHGKPALKLSRDASALLLAYDFPGNVRELQNIIERAVIVADGEKIEVSDLPEYLFSARKLIESQNSLLTLADMEALYIREILIKTRGHKSQAAAILGISRKSLYEKMKKYDIKL
ncbi:MAG: sigma-54-dependent Fis family transcriptional regulator [Blastocatellia bacterium]|nr:sigma-54-dependent Fis family transcriptional regulator [Blastocatellia bacterium]